jgi:hypothetical protein
MVLADFGAGFEGLAIMPAVRIVEVTGGAAASTDFSRAHELCGERRHDTDVRRSVVHD